MSVMFFLFFCSCVNPILYAFLSENFRKAFKQRVPRCFFCFFTREVYGAPGASTFRGAGPSLRYELTTMASNGGAGGGRKSNIKHKVDMANHQHHPHPLANGVGGGPTTINGAAVPLSQVHPVKMSENAEGRKTTKVSFLRQPSKLSVKSPPVQEVCTESIEAPPASDKHTFGR